MAITFRDQKPERITIAKAGDGGEPTRFFFEPTKSVCMRAKYNIMADGEGFRFGNLLLEVFRLALVGWENMQDADGKAVPFSVSVRDSLLDVPGLFTEDDVAEVWKGAKGTEGEQSRPPQEPNPGTSMPDSGKPSSGTGTPSNAPGASTIPAAGSPAAPARSSKASRRRAGRMNS